MKFSYNVDLRELSFGLTRLSFRDNFESSMIDDIVIPAGQERQISYKLVDGKVGRYFINLGQVGNGLVTKGATPWTANLISLVNNGAEQVTLSIVILGD